MSVHDACSDPKGSVRAGACVLILACALAVSGCGGEGGASSPEPSQQPLVGRDSVRLIRASARMSFHNPVWLPTLEKIVFTRSPAPGDAFRHDLAAVAIDGSALEPLPLPDEPGCKYTSKALPTALGDGRLGYVQQCWPGGGRVVTLMTWDPETEVTEPLVPYRLLFLQGPFACSPDLSTCVINDRNGLYEELQRVGPDGLERLDLPLERAGSPSWSPDGSWVALDGVPEGADGSGTDRLELPRDLYLLSADLERLRPLVKDIINVSASAWSSDGRWLALALKPKDGQEGLYLVDVATGKLILVLAGKFGAPTWLPDDASLAVPVGIESGAEETEGDVGLYIVALPESLATAG
jgi:Tol biopolymer transport system component